MRDTGNECSHRRHRALLLEPDLQIDERGDVPHDHDHALVARIVGVEQHRQQIESASLRVFHLTRRGRTPSLHFAGEVDHRRPRFLRRKFAQALPDDLTVLPADEHPRGAIDPGDRCVDTHDHDRRLDGVERAPPLPRRPLDRVEQLTPVVFEIRDLAQIDEEHDQVRLCRVSPAANDEQRAVMIAVAQSHLDLDAAVDGLREHKPFANDFARVGLDQVEQLGFCQTVGADAHEIRQFVVREKEHEVARNQRGGKRRPANRQSILTRNRDCGRSSS